MYTSLKYLAATVCCAILATMSSAADAPAKPIPDKYSVKVPGGLSFAEFRGYEKWEVISTSLTDKLAAVIVGDPAMIAAYKSGIPLNGKPFPDGVRMTKIHWDPAREQHFQARVPGALHDIDFMVKDSKRFADSGGWGYAAFRFDAATNTFSPVGMDGAPPQNNDAKCGFACHTVVKSRDFVFTNYAAR
jgi:hypothetical protein